jgi:Transposase domain (DUF772)
VVLLRKSVPQNHNLKTAAELGVIHKKYTERTMRKIEVRGVPLNSFPLDSQNIFFVAANEIDWNVICNRSEIFNSVYIPLQPTRRMVGLSILAIALNLSGQELLKQWLQIPYYQYFTGESLFHWDLPISNEELSLFESQLNAEIIIDINNIAVSIQRKLQFK